MKTLEEIIDTVPPGMSWLLRSDESGKFLANVIKVYPSGPIQGQMSQITSPVYAKTPHEALEKSIEEAKQKAGI